MASGNNGGGCGRARTALCAALIAVLLCGLCGCGDKDKSEPKNSQPAVTEKASAQTPEESADTEPKTLEQELLKRRGKSFDASAEGVDLDKILIGFQAGTRLAACLDVQALRHGYDLIKIY